jgi:hypothetical protein
MSDEDVYKTRPDKGNIVVMENPAFYMQLANAKNGSVAKTAGGGLIPWSGAHHRI